MPGLGGTRGEELIWCEADVRGDLAEEDRRDVAALVEGNSGEAAVGMPKLLV